MAEPLVAYGGHGIVRRLRKILRGIHRELWQRQLPHGLVSYRYLLPIDNQRVRIHRQLWWQSQPKWPRLLWLLIELWLWLRWVCFLGWRSSWMIFSRRGGEVQKQEGVSLWKQARTLIELSIGSCVPPWDVYSFRLYLESDHVWDIVFDHEIQAYHRWRSQSYGSGNTSHAMLSDKFCLTEMLRKIGIPMAPIWACIPQGSAPTPSLYLATGKRLFCKTRSGNCGIGAFTVWQSQEGIQGRRLSGETMSDAEAIFLAFRQILNHDDVLVQPCLANHPQLAHLSVNNDAITIRYISYQDGLNIRCLSATMEIPADQNEQSGQIFYVILPIEPESGRILSIPETLLFGSEAQKHHRAVLAHLSQEALVPGWSTLVEASQLAQTQFPDLWSIAWDWVITPDGPCLLEGNSGWGGITPQLLEGGFLK